MGDLRNIEVVSQEEEVVDQGPQKTPQEAPQEAPQETPQEKPQDAVVVEQGTIETDKKDLLWMGGVAECFTTVLSLFGRADLKISKDESWVVPYEEITEMSYVGSGAQGTVFKGLLRGEIVAFKKVKSHSETNIKHLRKLNHDNIVQFRGICTKSPNFGVIMEYCQYGPLYDYIHGSNQFAPKQLLKWAKEIALGLAYLHTHKIIHRDLKSPNILVADNLVLKVSDFGTSREWNDVSTIMSFTGTVAWMAPEVIRHEPCSERVDVWSYGVVLWELLTQEIPYKNVETHAIMWGVGTDTVRLHVPATIPGSFQLLLNQCWNRTPRNRPPFKIIAAHLDIAANDFIALEDDFVATQGVWREEVQDAMERLYVKTEQPSLSDAMQRREELNKAQCAREVYEAQLSRANELYMEVCSVRLQLEQREQALLEREQALNKACRCGLRKKFFQRQLSSSSDGLKKAYGPPANAGGCCKKKSEGIPAQVLLSFDENNPDQPISVVLKEEQESTCCDCCDDRFENNNMATIKDTVVEKNGNVDFVEKFQKLDNYMSNVAQV